MKYHLNGSSPISFMIADKKSRETAKITLKPGDGEISKTVFEAIEKLAMTKALVEEGLLNFPESKDFSSVYGVKLKEFRERQKRFSAEREKAEREKADNPDNAELIKTVGNQAEEIARLTEEKKAMEKRMARLEEMLDPAKKESPKKTTKKDQTVASDNSDEKPDWALAGEEKPDAN